MRTRAVCTQAAILMYSHRALGACPALVFGVVVHTWWPPCVELSAGRLSLAVPGEGAFSWARPYVPLGSVVPACWCSGALGGLLKRVAPTHTRIDVPLAVPIVLFCLLCHIHIALPCHKT